MRLDGEVALLDLTFGFADGSCDTNQIKVEKPEFVRLFGPSRRFQRLRTFVIVRAAGTFVCRGRTGSDSNAGTANFLPNPAYVDALAARGSVLNHRQQLDSALFDISMSVVERCAEIFGRIVPSDVLTLAVMQVSVSYAGEMRAVSPTATIKEIFGLRSFEISSAEAAAFQRPRSRAPFAATDVIEMKVARVDANYVRDLAATGYGSFSSDDIVALRFQNVDASFICRAGLEHKQLTAHEPIAKKLSP